MKKQIPIYTCMQIKKNRKSAKKYKLKVRKEIIHASDIFNAKVPIKQTFL